MASSKPNLDQDRQIDYEYTISEISQAKSSQNINKEQDESQITCLICYSDIYSNNIMTPLSCGHKFCLICFKHYLDNKINSFQIINIPCPQDGCESVFLDNHVRDILDEDRYNKYQELVLKKLENKIAYKKVCPKPGCARAISLSNNKKAYIKCLCGVQICKNCFNFWHPGKSCLNTLDPHFELYAYDNSIKFCVMCKTPVARVEGCLHMTCCVCDYEWCWACGKQYDMKHKCDRYWNPSAPFIFAQQPLTKKLSIIFGTILKILGFVFVIMPITAIVFLLFWPYTMVEPEEKLTWRRPFKSAGTLFASGLIGLFCLPFTLLWVFVFAFLVSPMKFILITRRRGFRFWLRKKGRIQRWMTGNLATFSYTEVARPVQNNIAAVEAAVENLVEQMNNLVLSPVQQRIRNRRYTWPGDNPRANTGELEEKVQIPHSEHSQEEKEIDIDIPQKIRGYSMEIPHYGSDVSCGVKDKSILSQPLPYLGRSKSFEEIKRLKDNFIDFKTVETLTLKLPELIGSEIEDKTIENRDIVNIRVV